MRRWKSTNPVIIFNGEILYSSTAKKLEFDTEWKVDVLGHRDRMRLQASERESTMLLAAECPE